MLRRNTIIRLYSASPTVSQTKKCAVRVCSMRMAVENRLRHLHLLYVSSALADVNAPPQSGIPGSGGKR
jgi:hypothetical protein